MCNHITIVIPHIVLWCLTNNFHVTVYHGHVMKCGTTFEVGVAIRYEMTSHDMDDMTFHDIVQYVAAQCAVTNGVS